MFKRKARLFTKYVINGIPVDSILLATNVRAKEGDDQKHYYQDSLFPIKKFLKSFEYKGKTESMFRCGYDYILKLYDSGKFPLELKACFECNYIYFQNAGYKIEKEQFLYSLKKYCKNLDIEELTFSSLEEGRHYLHQANKNQKLVGGDRFFPNWYSFEGCFQIIWEDSGQSLAKIINKVQSRISTEFPDEKYEIRINHTDFRSGIFYLYIDCNESLFHKLDWQEKQEPWTKHVYFNTTAYHKA